MKTLFSLYILIIGSFFITNAQSDEFNGSSLDASWTIFQGEHFENVLVNNGELRISMNQTLCNFTDVCVWFKAETGGFIYKEITGDFDVETQVLARKRSNPNADIDSQTQLAGLMIRDPNNSNGESYIFNNIGYRLGNIRIEVKTTVDGSSNASEAFTPDGSTNAELRITRLGDFFTLYARALGSNDWGTPLITYTRSLPTTLQVGLISHTFSSPPEILARFDYIRFNGAVNATTWDGATWNNGTPTAADHVIINGNYNTATDGDITANDITINSGVNVTIAAGNFMEVNGDLIHFGASFTVVSGGSLVTKGNITGTNFTFERITTFDSNTGRYSIVGSPVSGANFNVLGVNAIIYGYDETKTYNDGGNNGLDRFRTPAQLSQTELQVGHGYFSAYTGDVNGKIIFSGTPNNGTQSVSLSYTNVLGEEAYEGFNLVSNPYPSAIDFTELMNENAADVEGAIYLWDDFDSENQRGTDADYVVVNAMGIVNPSDRSNDAKYNGIHSMQGFFVQAKSTGDLTLDFTDAMKITGNNTDAGFYRKLNEQISFKLVMNNADGEYSETLIGMKEDAAWEIDQYDARLFNQSGTKIYSLINGEAYAIQGLPKSNDAIIPIGISSGEYISLTISIAEEENLEAYRVILIDHLLETTTELSARVQYSFTSLAEQTNDRFSLQVVSTLTAIEYNNKPTFIVHQNLENSLTIRVNSQEKVIGVKIASLTGQQQVLKFQQVNNQEWKTNKVLLRGLYIINVITDKSVHSQRMILK